MNKWEPVTGSLPDYHQNVLCYSKHMILVAYIVGIEPHGEHLPDWRMVDSDGRAHKVTHDITHWRMLPESPVGQDT